MRRAGRTLDRRYMRLSFGTFCITFPRRKRERNEAGMTLPIFPQVRIEVTVSVTFISYSWAPHLKTPSTSSLHSRCTLLTLLTYNRSTVFIYNSFGWMMIWMIIKKRVQHIRNCTAQAWKHQQHSSIMAEFCTSQQHSWCLQKMIWWLFLWVQCWLNTCGVKASIFKVLTQ